MKNHGLRFEVKRYSGVPLISAKGYVDAWQMETLKRLLHSFNWKGHQDVIVDLTGVEVGDRDGAQALAEMVKSWRPEMDVDVVAAGPVLLALSANSYPFTLRPCSSLAEAAQWVCRMRRSAALTDDAYSLPAVSIDDLPRAA